MNELNEKPTLPIRGVSGSYLFDYQLLKIKIQ